MPSYSCPRCDRKMTLNGHAGSGKPRWICRGGSDSRSVCYTTTDPTIDGVRTQSGSIKRSSKTPIFKRSLGGKTTVIITAAQNATPAHKGFVKALELCANDHDAEILAIPLRYKNPTSRWTKSQANDDIWAPEITPYLCNERKKLNKNLIVLGDVKVQPTASSPLNGFEAMTHGESGILGHPKIHSKTVATPQSRMPKLLSTTGVATMRNYTDSRAGKQGDFHHSLGALIVEIQGGKFHMRRINADKKTGSFIELDRHYGVDYTKSGIADAPPALALVHGDQHVDFADPKVVRAQDHLAKALKVKKRIVHDLNDAYSVNHHHRGNPLITIAKMRHNRSDARAEMERSFDFLEQRITRDCELVVIPSNHMDFIERWIIEKDWRTDPGNAEFYLETALAMVRGTHMDKSGTVYPDPFTYWGRKRFGDRVRFLDNDESLMIEGIELGMHGHNGPNGARGSIKNLRRIGVKSIIGHGHSPGEDEGCMQTGTSTYLRLEYTRGPSGWLNTDALIYANGKRTLINYIDGEYRI